MTSQATPRSQPPPSLPRVLVAQTRMQALRDELDIANDARARALLELELGALYEHVLGQREHALACYRRAHEQAPDLLPPLLSIAQAAIDQPALAVEAWQALARTTSALRDGADALCEAGILLCDELGAPEQGAALFRRALEADPTCATAALLLEHEERAGRNIKEAERASEVLARAVSDVELEASLLCEGAAAEHRAGHGAAALAKLETASELGAQAPTVWRATERIARKHARPDRQRAALDALAALETQQAGAGAPERARSAAFSRSAARVAALRLQDIPGAVARYSHALAQQPRDLLALWERVLVTQAHGPRATAIADARALIESAGDSPLAAALHVRCAELLTADGNLDGAIEQLQLAVQRDAKSSCAVAAIDDVLVRGGRSRALLDYLLARAERCSGQARADHLLRAGRVAVLELRDTQRGFELLSQAAEHATQPELALRTLYAAAVWAGDAMAAVDAAQALCGRRLDAAERTTLRFDQYERLRGAGDLDGALALLEAALLETSNAAWAPPAARIQGASRRNMRLLADAHRALAQQPQEPAQSAAHLCAAARALLRSGDAHAALAELRAALARAPDDAYALALLEEGLLSSGGKREVASALREAAQTHAGTRRRELALLHAGAAAEAAFDPEAAARSYLEAAAHDASSIAPLWALRRLAERGGDNAMLQGALERLSARNDRAGTLAQLELGELLATAGQARAASLQLAKVLVDAELGTSAALDLWLLPDSAVPEALREQARIALLQACGEHARPALLRSDIAARAQHGETRAHELSVALDACPDDVWLSYAALLASTNPDQRADAWQRLARVGADPGASAELTLHAIRVAQLGRGAGAAAESVLQALQASQQAPGALSAAVALDETLSAGDDAESRAAALFDRLAHASVAATPALRSARGSALLAAGRAREAADVARSVLAQDEGDLAAWELLRQSARELGDFASVAEAARHLADHAQGRFRALLLEEAAVVLERELAQPEEAELCLLAAFASDPTSEVAFARLHDLLLDRRELPTLVGLLEQRIATATDIEERFELCYERALALRADGHKEQALTALQDVLASEPTHAGALGLLVETSTALERWDVAVAALQRLAEASVPLAQQRVARLGAAEFLERKLGDVDAACAELQALDVAGISDHAVLVRMAELNERAGRYRTAVDAYRRAAEQAPRRAAAELELRAGDILRDRLGAQNEALLAYQQALAADPLNAQVCARLLDLVPQGDDRERLIGAFEQSVRAALEREPARPDLVRLLARVARWAQRGDLELCALAALAALGALEPDERQTLAQLMQTAHARAIPEGAEAALRRVGTPATSSPLARAAVLASQALIAFEGAPVSSATLAADLAQASDAARRYELGRAWLANALGVKSLAERTRASQREVLHACLSLSGREQAPPAIDELGKRIGKQLGRAQRKELTRAMSALDAPVVQIEAYLDVLDASLARAGLLLADDLSAAWAHGMSGERAELDALVSSPRQLDLLRFWLSPRLLELRRELGWGP